MKNFVWFFLLSFSIEGVFGESVSVTDGDSVTLHTGLTEIQEDDVLEWRFGDGRVRIARVRKDSKPTIYEDVLGGRFRDRLKLDGQTGDLTITNTTTEHAGPYEISINAIALRTFTVNVVSGVHEVKSVSLTVGDSVTLNSGTIIQKDDVIEWRFGDLNSLIAENRKTGNFSTSDERFRDRLQLDYWTGSLTIRNIGTKHSGLYEADIRKSSSLHTIHKSFNVTAGGERKSVSVMEGGSVTLEIEIQTDDLMQWMFGDTVIAEINKAGDRFLTSDGPDGSFRGRLKLDHQTGSLNITHTRTTDSGLYELKISSSRFIINRRVTVTVTGERKSELSVMNGDSVTLHTDLTEIQTDDVMQWMFEDTVLAEVSKAQKRFLTSDSPDGRFRGRLKLDHQTGSLTITHTRFTDSGLYELKISSSRFIINKRITVTVIGERKSVSVMKGDSVTLHTDLTEIQTDDVIQWMFGDTVLAEVSKAHKRFLIHDGPDGRFRDRLQLDHQTGSLTITHTRDTDSGLYELKISSSRFTINKRITVTVIGERKSVSVMEGDSVTLHTGLTEIQTDDVMQWMFGDTVLAEINKAHRQSSTSDGPDGRFGDRLQLDPQTGSLTITDTRYTDSGLYKLKISSSRFIINRRLTVTVTVTDPGLSPGAIAGIVVVGLLALFAAVPAVAAFAAVIYYRHKISEVKALKRLTLMEGETVTLILYGIELPKDEDIQWKFGGAVIAERKGFYQKITVNDAVLGEKFKGRLQLDKCSGFLIITNITTTDSGHYELWSGTSGMKPLKTFYVSVYAKTDIVKEPVKMGGSVTLPTGVADIKKVDEIQWKFRLYDSPIAQITGGTSKISPFATGWRFRGRLKLDQDGSLTISKIELNHTGLYVLYITDNEKTTMKLFKVKVVNNPEEPEEVPLNSVL